MAADNRIIKITKKEITITLTEEEAQAVLGYITGISLKSDPLDKCLGAAKKIKQELNKQKLVIVVSRHNDLEESKRCQKLLFEMYINYLNDFCYSTDHLCKINYNYRVLVCDESFGSRFENESGFHAVVR